MLLPIQPIRAAGEDADWAGAQEEHLQRSAAGQLDEVDGVQAGIHTTRGRPASVIVDHARSIGADLLVLGAHHQPAVARFLLGSTSEKIVRMSDIPMLIATEPRERPFERVLAAFDLSPVSRAALDAAVTMAILDKAVMRVLYVDEPVNAAVVHHMSLGQISAVGMDGARAIVDAMHREAKVKFEEVVAETNENREVQVEPKVRVGHAGDEIVREADEWDADLVVLGTHGAGFFERVMMGSRSLHVLRHSERTTLLVPRKGVDEA
jgi:nucleotide-binding universal stress UspA family protein